MNHPSPASRNPGAASAGSGTFLGRSRAFRLIHTVALAGIVLIGASDLMAQKKPGGGGGGGGGDTSPVPAGTLHFIQSAADTSTSAEMTMKADGSGKTQIGTSEQGWWEPSHQLHGGQRWFLAILPTETKDPDTGGMREELFAVTVDGQSVQLTNDPNLFLSGAWSLRWAKDDSFLSYVAEERVTWNEALFAIDVDWSSGMPVIGAARMVLESGYNSGDPQLPAFGAYDWSPSGEELVYNDLHDWDRHEIRIARFFADGTIETRHVGDKGLYPTWSPDGNWIAYGSLVEGAIWKIRTDGSGAVQLSTIASGQQHTDTVWSPDSQHLAFTQKTRTTSTKRGVTTYTYTYDILRISASGGTAANLTTDTAADCWPIGWR